MFDTYITVVGNVLHEPEQRQVSSTGTIVTTFKISSTARRLDRQTGKWTDGNSLRVRVNSWRALASNVKQSVKVGDPLIVHGKLFTRDWTDEQGNKRLAYELEAMAIGHDLSRGRAVFERVKQRTITSAIEDAESEQRVGGVLTELVPDGEADQFDDTPFEAVFDQPAAAPFAHQGIDGADGEWSAGGQSPDGGAEGATGETAEATERAAERAVAETVAETADEAATGRRRGLRRSRVPV